MKIEISDSYSWNEIRFCTLSESGVPLPILTFGIDLKSRSGYIWCVAKKAKAIYVTNMKIFKESHTYLCKCNIPFLADNKEVYIQILNYLNEIYNEN